MEKAEIKLTIDEYRMRALTFYLGKENASVQTKMGNGTEQEAGGNRSRNVGRNII